MKCFLGWCIAAAAGVILLGCEPVSVSVNKRGEIAFTRSEGVFFFHPRSGRLSTVKWNHGQETVPAIVRWSPNGERLAYTVKSDDKGRNTAVYVADRSGKNEKKVYTASKRITQLEWSPDGKRLSAAQAGENTKLQVADLVMIDVASAMSKVLLKDTGDVHTWVDAETLAVMKINSKDEKTRLFNAALTLVNTGGGGARAVLKTVVSKVGSLDYNDNEVLFTAAAVDTKAITVTKDMKKHSYVFLYHVTKKKHIKLSDEEYKYIAISPNGQMLLLKQKTGSAYSPTIRLAYFPPESKKPRSLVSPVLDTVKADNATVQVYPAWYTDNAVLYWEQPVTYSGSGKAMRLMKLDIKTGRKENLQIRIDQAVHKKVMAKGGY